MEIFEDKKASDQYDGFHFQRHKYTTMNELLRQYERFTGERLLELCESFDFFMLYRVYMDMDIGTMLT